MINAIKRIFGMHVHEWGAYGDPVTQEFEQTTPVIEERVVEDAWGDEIIEEFDTGLVEVSRWTETTQSRTCSGCGKVEVRRVAATFV